MSSHSVVPWVQIFGSLGTWVFVVVGWLVVSDQQDRREIAKNVFARVDVLRGALSELEKVALKHHTQGFEPKTVKEVLRSISAISSEISHLRRAGFLEVSCVTKMLNLRSAMTLHNFDSSGYKVLELESPIILEFEVRKDQLDRALMEAAHRVATQPKTLGQSLVSAARRIA